MKKAALFLLLACASWLSAQPADNLIPRELLFREKDKSEVTFHPDGDMVLYRKPGPDSLIWYRTCDRPLVERSFAFSGPVTDWMPGFDHTLVALVGQGDSLHLEWYQTAAGHFRQVDGPTFGHAQLLMASRRLPNKVLLKENGPQGAFFLVDLLSGRTRQLLLPAGDFSRIFFNENFGIVAAEQPNDLGGIDILRRTATGWEVVFTHAFHPEYFIGGLSHVVSVSSDGSTIYATSNQGRDKTALYAIDVSTGDTTLLAQDSLADILPWGASTDADGKVTSVVALWADSRRHVVDPGWQADFDFLEKKLGPNVGFVAADARQTRWLLRTFDGGPIDYFLYERGSDSLTFLFNDYSHLDGFDLATRKAYTVTTRDGLRLPVHVYVPPGMAADDGKPRVPLPTVIYIHGGPWAGVTHWNSWFHKRNFQLLANRHYVVINMEFRGSTGLGKAFCDAGNLQWGGAMHDDIVDVARWAVEQGIAHPDRIGLWGWSYGGYAVNYALGRSPDLFACGISMYGISDLEAFCELPFADNDTWRQRVGNVHTPEGRALLRRHSPIHLVEHYRKPLLLTTGSLDDRVPQEQSDRFAKALAEAGKDVVYFYYPNEGHDYRQPKSWVSFWAVAEHFLHLHLRGRKQPKGQDLTAPPFEVVYGKKFLEEIW